MIDKNVRGLDPTRVSAIKYQLPTMFPGFGKLSQRISTKHAWFASFVKQTIKKDAKWVWTIECQEAFEKIKGILTSDLFLTHYDPKKEIILASDASSCGIRACIMHQLKDGSVKHTSRMLLSAKKELFRDRKGEFRDCVCPTEISYIPSRKKVC